LLIVKAQISAAAAEQAEQQQGSKMVLWWCAGHGKSVAGPARIVLNRAWGHFSNLCS